MEIDLESDGGFAKATGDQATIEALKVSMEATGWVFDRVHEVWLAPGYNEVPTT